MDFKLSEQACRDIASRNDYTLAYSEELERLRLELEKAVGDFQTRPIQGQIFQLRQHMKLKERAFSRIS